jgi:CubicO group peptidase (beta-lactamase class C family)
LPVGEPIQGDAIRSEKIDEAIQAHTEKERVPGLSLALVRNGTVLKSKGYGFANLELSAPVHPDTVFQIGSITKQFTAAGILLLWDAGKLDLDAPVHAYLDGLPDAWKPLTLRHLLEHTSSLANVTELPEFSYRIEYTRQELIDLVAARPPAFPPGEKWEYTNTGYILLAWILEDVSGKSYGEFLTERVFEPLGMESTRVIVPEEIVPNRAEGYCWEDGRHCNGESLRPREIVGAGGLLSTTLDLAKWDAALYSEIPLKRRLKEAMWTPARLNDGTLARTETSCGERYGFGWFLGEYRGHRLVSHTGETDAGFSSEIMRFVDDRFTLILLSNVEPMEQDQLTKRVARLCLEG